MVAAQDEEVLRVLDLVREEEADGLERLLAPVDVVAEEEVVGFGGEPAILEQAQQVVVLPVDVTCTVHAWSVSEAGEESERDGLGRGRNAPQILIGASSSRRMGWLMKISRALVHRNLISYSCS